MDRLRSHRGITIWELVIIIFVIVVVALILFPVFVPHGCPSNQSMCLSNLKQLALAMMQYTQDNDDRFPICRRTEANGKNLQVSAWDEVLLPYIKSNRVLKCQSHTLDKSESTYAMNALLITVKGNTSKGLALKEVSETDMVITFFDGNTGGRDIKIGHGMVADRFKMVSKEYNPQNTFAMKHLEGDNFAFADGHVKWIKTSDLAWEAPIERLTWDFDGEISFLPDFKSGEKP